MYQEKSIINLITSVVNIFFVAILVTGCSPSEKESAAIVELNSKYPEYEISHFTHVIDNYFAVTIKAHRVDTIQIKEIFDNALGLAIDSTGKRRLSWTHMIVYDSTRRYLFTLKKSNGRTILFIDSIH
ncbi:MAG: hypothetical protein M9954_13760 [Cyclobacteriaceae bacterium]|nr:hypothetical protein [Flammeovirgaceae bacterium]MCO5272719.1 hypothetical protein [Cyclobacteriaceae bacterium]